MTSIAMLTNVGRNKEAQALATGGALVITEMAWGDGDRIPGGGETALENELGRKDLNGQGLTQGATNTAFFEILLDETEGPFVIREAGLFDADGDMVAIARYDPAVNKPLNTVSAVLRINVLFSDLENLVLQVQSTALFAPEARVLVAGDGLVGGGDLSEDRTFAVAFATEPEAVGGVVTDKSMTPALVKGRIDAAIAALVGGAPGALDTLNELAAALGDDENALAALTSQIAAHSLDLQDIQSGGRIAPHSKTVADWDDAIQTGWFTTADLTALNQPEADKWYLGLVVTQGAGWLVQTLVDYVSTSNNRTWRRHQRGGGWGAWERVYHTANDLDAWFATSPLTPTAWVNFDGTGVVSILDGWNIASVTDLGVGNYRVNFDTPMANADYAVVTGGYAIIFPSLRTTTHFEFQLVNVNGAAVDAAPVSAIVMGGV